MITFLISGILHTLAEFGGGRKLREFGTLRFFVTQAFEDSVQAMSRSVGTRYQARCLSRGARPIGYIWVAVFLFWSTPAWLYPDAATPPKKSFLPFTILGAGATAARV